jgi:hypothetical protein
MYRFSGMGLMFFILSNVLDGAPWLIYYVDSKQYIPGPRGRFLRLFMSRGGFTGRFPLHFCSWRIHHVRYYKESV